jgi:hypothetical protein
MKDKLIEVCSNCKTAICWYGEIMCWESENASTEIIPTSKLKEMKLEHSENWSDEKMKKIYGRAAPYGYKEESKGENN